MLEFLLIIILLPIALATGAVLLFGAFLFWKYIVAICLWIAAAGAFIIDKLNGGEGNMFWWALGLFIVGTLFWASGSLDKETESHKKH